MNKTVNINLGGIFFYIDEDAYQKLSKYFEAIKRSLSNSSGQDEIIKDIEMRVAELLTEKQKSDKHVISNLDVDQVISVMGQPEDYRIDDDNTEQKINYFSGNSNQKSRKLYRDREKGTIGGVATGLGYYFGIDAIWIKIAFLAIVWAGGAGFIAYLVLWIVMPEANTTAEKLEMRGEPVNISNIEKKVREEFASVSEKFKDANGKIVEDVKNFNGKYGNKINHEARNVGNSLGDFIITIARIFGKFIGGIIVMIAGITLISLFITLFTLGSTTFIHTPWLDYFNSFNYSNTSMFFISLLFFFAIGIPFFFLLILGLKIIVPTIKSIGNIAKYTLLAVWLLAIAILVALGINQAREVAFESKTYDRQAINIKPTDTLFIKFKSNDYYDNHHSNSGNFKIVTDSTSRKLIYSNDINIEIMKTDEKLPYLQIEKSANGSSTLDAKKRAEKIDFKFKIDGNKIVFDDYFLTDLSNKFRGQEVQLFLYLPENTIFKTDDTFKDYDDSNDDFFNLHWSSDNYIYKVGDNKVKCINCPINENGEFDDVENSDIDIDIDTTNDENININSPNIKINKNGISITSDSSYTGKKEFKELKINKDGIIIKTK
ncbi:MAG: PspC domain-containing protein [Flavobacterium sp.]|nr:PspC domain-containing protein [Flavobacterium sp.]